MESRNYFSAVKMINRYEPSELGCIARAHGLTVPSECITSEDIVNWMFSNGFNPHALPKERIKWETI